MINKQPQLHEYTQQSQTILTWLQTFNKPSTKVSQSGSSSSSSALQQQLQSLSLSYKNAQQKLLSLQKQTYYQSLHNEKQRSIIQILKYIINGSLDDDTILTYLVEMQDESIPDAESKYQIRTQLEDIKQILLKRKMDGKKADSLKAGLVNDLKKEIAKCQQVKKELIEDLDRTLNEKGQLQTQLQQLQTLTKSQSQQISHLQNQLQTLKLHHQHKITQHSALLSCQQQLSTISQHLNKSIKNPAHKIQNPTDILKWIKVMEEKHNKYKAVIRDQAEQLGRNRGFGEMVAVLKMFVSQEGMQVYEEFQKTANLCLLKEIQGIARLQRKKYQQLQMCQEEVWRLKERLLRQGSWLKSRNTRIPSDNKQNSQPNNPTNQPKNPKTSQFAPQ